MREGVREAILSYKYRRALWFEPYLAELLIGAAGPELAMEKWDWIVPVPLHPAKEREREFNQAERLAQRLAAATGIPLDNKLIRRTVPTPTQTVRDGPRSTRYSRSMNGITSSSRNLP